MTKESFKSDIQQHFRFLFDKWGFTFVDVENDSGGNLVIAHSGELKIRFIHDRADFFLDVARIDDPDGWIGLYKVADFLKSEGRIHARYKYSNKIKPVSRVLEKYFSEIQKFFSDSQFSLIECRT